MTKKTVKWMLNASSRFARCRADYLLRIGFTRQDCSRNATLNRVSDLDCRTKVLVTVGRVFSNLFPTVTTG